MDDHQTRPAIFVTDAVFSRLESSVAELAEIMMTALSLADGEWQRDYEGHAALANVLAQLHSIVARHRK